MTVRIVTDSAAALPRATAALVATVPMWTSVDGHLERDGARAFGDVVAAGSVDTAAPSPSDYERAIGGGASHDGAVVLTVASTMSASYASATIAAARAGSRVVVVDTGTATAAQGLVVDAAARAAAAGDRLDAVARAAARAADHVRFVATVPNLGALRRSGRVPELDDDPCAPPHEPVFEFRDGKASRVATARDHTGALDMMAATVLASAPLRGTHLTTAGRLHVLAVHAAAEASAHDALARVTREVVVARAEVLEAGTVITAHTGRGLVGLAWYWR